MSSIYKKGRDGYYYYQTYVLNPETGKKDKRLFHSLGTKNHNEAEQIKIELDRKYESLKRIKGAPLSNKINKKNIYIVFTTLIITLTISWVYKSKKAPLKRKMHIPYGNNSSLEEENMITKNSDNLVLHPEKHAEDLKNSSFNTSIDKKENDFKKYDIPPFQIQRVKPISERFKQAKIFVTVPSNIEGEKIRLACKNIVEQFPEYSNMVICVYDDSELGLELALGERSFINTKEQKLAWKALYAFNPVEGEYFDDNPNDYLGAN